MTWNEAVKPPEWADITSAKFGDIFELGESVALTLSQTVPSGTYETRNIEGIVPAGASGSLSGTSLTPTGLVCGWYDLMLTSPTSIATWGTARGEAWINVIRPDSRFPARPARGTAYNAGGTAFNAIVRGLYGLGPHRHFIHNVETPNTPFDGDGTIAICNDNQAMEVTWYGFINEPNRPPKTEGLVHFPNWSNTSAQRTGATSVVGSLINRFKWFEFTNEPQGTPAATVATNFIAFADAIHAGSAQAKALGPNPVGINKPSLDWLDSFYNELGASGRDKLDGLSYHWYNSVGSGGGDLALTLRCLRKLADIHAKYGMSGKTLWQTEQGMITATYGAFQPRMSAKWAAIRMIASEQFGFVTERDHVWIGNFVFFDQPMYQVGIGGQPTVEALLYRTFVAERFNKTYTSKYDFGADYEYQLIGSLYTNQSTGDKMAVFLNGGFPEDDRPTIKLGITGASSVTQVDAFGNTSTLSVSNGQITVTVPELPVYLRLPNGVTATFQGSGMGQDFAKYAIVSTNPVGSIVKAQKATHGEPQTQYWDDVSDVASVHACWETTTLPATLTATLPNPQRADYVEVEFAPPWQYNSTSLHHEIYTSTDGTTFTLRTTVGPRATKDFSRVSHKDQSACFAHEYWDRAHIFRTAVPLGTYKAIRVRILKGSLGGYPTDTVRLACGTHNNADTTVERGMVRAIRLFSTDTLVARLIMVS